MTSEVEWADYPSLDGERSAVCKRQWTKLSHDPKFIAGVEKVLASMFKILDGDASKQRDEGEELDEAAAQLVQEAMTIAFNCIAPSIATQYRMIPFRVKFGGIPDPVIMLPMGRDRGPMN